MAYYGQPVVYGGGGGSMVQPMIYAVPVPVAAAPPAPPVQNENCCGKTWMKICMILTSTGFLGTVIIILIIFGFLSGLRGS